MFIKGVSIEELLSIDPLTNSKILGGWSGKSKLFKKITSTIAADAMHDQLLIIDNYKQDFKITDEIIIEILNKKVSAVFIIGSSEPYLPKRIIDYTNTLQIPIIYLPEVKEILTVNKTAVLIQHLKDAEVFLDYLQSANDYLIRILNEFGLEYLISYLETFLTTPIILVDPFFKIINIKNNQSKILNQDKVEFIKQSYYRKINENKNLNYQNLKGVEKLEPIPKDNKYNNSFYILKLKSGRTKYGYLLVDENNIKLTEFNLILLKRAVSPIITELIKTDLIIKTEKKYKDNFIYDLLNNNFDSHNTIIKQGAIWGWNLAIPYQLIIIELKTDNNLGSLSFGSVLHIINITMSAILQNYICIEVNGQIIILIPDNDENQNKKKYIKSIAATIQKKILSEIKELNVLMGIGKFYDSPTHLYRSYQEAKTAIELGKYNNNKCKITHFEDLGVMRLLANIRQENLDDFHQEYLGKLTEVDQNNENDLLNTLRSFFSENGNLKTTSAELFIHINTLRYRLKKIEKILDVDLENIEDRLNLFVAIKIDSLRN